MLERIKKTRAAGEEGFTLIELLVVIIILGILAAVVVFAVGGVSDKGVASSCKIDTRTIRTAEEAYAANNGNKYTDLATLKSAGFLSDDSKYHDVVPATAGEALPWTGFKVVTKLDTGGTPPTKSSCTLPTGGAAGVVVDGTAAI